MEFQTFLTLVGEKRKALWGIIALFIVAGVVLIAAQQPFKYRTDSQLLLVQERQGVVIDAYTASKSSEYLSRVLASVVTSNSFYNKVTTSSPSINTAYFGNTPREQIRGWEKTVTARNLNDTGIIAVSVYHPDRAEAEKIAGAVNYILMTQHSAYDGANESVKVRLINQPVTSSFPVSPNMPLIIGLAMALGLVTGLMYIYLVADVLVKTNQLNMPLHDPIVEERLRQLQAVHEEKPTPAYSQPRPPAQSYQAFNEASRYGSEPSSQRTDFGNHASVPMNQSEPQNYTNVREEYKEEDIFKQGNMRNIL